MSQGSNATSALARLGSGTGRLVRAYRALPHERRLAVYASIGLFVTLFLPWYQETVVAAAGTKSIAASASLTGWGAFSFVEAAVLVVAVGVLTLLFQRAEGRAFHIPGGDGGVVTAAGFWTCVLVVWRIFDKQSVDIRGPGTSISGIEWGIFVALGVAVFLTYAGTRIRAAHRPEPPLPGERVQAEAAPAAEATPAAETARFPRNSAPFPRNAPSAPRSARPDALMRQPRPIPAEDPPTQRLPDKDPPTERLADEDPTQVVRPHAEDQLTIPFDDGES